MEGELHSLHCRPVKAIVAAEGLCALHRTMRQEAAWKGGATLYSMSDVEHLSCRSATQLRKRLLAWLSSAAPRFAGASTACGEGWHRHT